MSEKFVAISVDGEIKVHALDTTGNYATLCGLDGNDPDPSVRQTGAFLPARPKITCVTCAAIIRLARTYKLSDIEVREGT